MSGQLFTQFVCIYGLRKPSPKNIRPKRRQKSWKWKRHSNLCYAFVNSRQFFLSFDNLSYRFLSSVVFDDCKRWRIATQRKIIQFQHYVFEKELTHDLITIITQSLCQRCENIDFKYSIVLPYKLFVWARPPLSQRKSAAGRGAGTTAAPRQKSLGQGAEIPDSPTKHGKQRKSQTVKFASRST